MTAAEDLAEASRALRRFLQVFMEEARDNLLVLMVAVETAAWVLESQGWSP